jgi:hypothetical protein
VIAKIYGGFNSFGDEIEARGDVDVDDFEADLVKLSIELA